MLGASPFGVPVTSPDQVNSVRPAASRRDDAGRDRGVERQDLVFGCLGPEQVFQLLQLGWVFGGNVLELRPVLAEIVQLVRETGRILVHRALLTFAPPLLIAHHLEVLSVMPRRCVHVLRIEGVHHAHTFDRLLRDAVDHGRRLDAGRFQDRRHDINHVVELVADAVLVLDHLRPRDRHALACSAEVRRDLLGPGERRVERPSPCHGHVRIGLVRAPGVVEIFELSLFAPCSRRICSQHSPLGKNPFKLKKNFSYNEWTKGKFSEVVTVTNPGKFIFLAGIGPEREGDGKIVHEGNFIE